MEVYVKFSQDSFTNVRECAGVCPLISGLMSFSCVHADGSVPTLMQAYKTSLSIFMSNLTAMIRKLIKYTIKGLWT